MSGSNWNHQTILDAIPHRPPFLFVDEIVDWTDSEITTTYTCKGNEFFFEGHYPGAPLVPGVILCESAMQAGAVLLSKLFAVEAAKGRLADSDDPNTKIIPVVGRMKEVKVKRMVSPGETIVQHVHMKEKMGGAYFLTARITVEGELAVSFEFTCIQTRK